MGLGLVSASLAAASAVVGCEGNCEDKLSCGPQVVSDGGSVAAGGSGGTGDGGTGGAGGMGPSYPPGAAIATGVSFSCAMVAGTVHCWGNNDRGQVGNGSAAAVEPSPQQVELADAALEIVAGAAHACARLTDGSVWCWGANDEGQLGDGSFVSRSEPVLVAALDPAVELSAGSFNTYARHSDGSLSAWGRGKGLGNGSGSGQHSGVPTVAPLQQVLSLHEDTCAQLTTGTLSCWGVEPDYLPVEIATPTAVTSAANHILWAAGAEAHLCVSTAQGSVLCRGSNFCGVLGLGAGTTDVADLTTLGDLQDVESVVCGASYCLATEQGGLVKYWGTLVTSDCEDFNMVDAYTPSVLPFGGSAVHSMSVGHEHACILDEQERVYCWGNNQDGALGNGSSGGVEPVPTQVGGL